MERSRAFVWTLAGVMALAVAGGPALAGSAQQPDVTDDNAGEAGLPPALDVRLGWVGNETASSFSVFMQIAALDAPPNASTTYHYHFHFQVERTDGTTALYHAMVHHTSAGAWTYVVQRWVSTGGTGAWGETNTTQGWVDGASHIIEVAVAKAFVVSPAVDIQRGTWTIDRFYIHADAVDSASAAVLQTDTAPAVGTMGSYEVSQGAPQHGGKPSPGADVPLALGAAAAALLLLSVRKRRRTRGPD